MSIIKYLFFYPEKQGNQFSKGLMLGMLLIAIPLVFTLIKSEGNCLRINTIAVCKES